MRPDDMVSAYVMRNDGSVFGHFFGCDGNERLGYNCDQHVERCEDGDERVSDVFGLPVRRGAMAIHVSGLDRYGDMSFGGLIREIGINHEQWSDSDEFRPSVIVRTQHERHGLHVAEWSDSEYWVTLDGIHRHMVDVQPFTPQQIIDAVNWIRKSKGWPKYRMLEGAQHARAIRRLLESAVGVSNLAAGAVPSKRYPRACGAPLVRATRWSYQFCEPD